jgi:hypothetical protein
LIGTVALQPFSHVDGVGLGEVKKSLGRDTDDELVVE